MDGVVLFELCVPDIGFLLGEGGMKASVDLSARKRKVATKIRSVDSWVRAINGNKTRSATNVLPASFSDADRTSQKKEKDCKFGVIIKG